MCRERLKLAAHAAWSSFLGQFALKYDELRFAVRHLATLDCLFSLAAVAAQAGYVRPVFGARLRRCVPHSAAQTNRGRTSTSRTGDTRWSMHC